MGGIHRLQAGFIAARSSWLVAVITLCALGACTGAPSRTPAHVGTYALESVDGRPLPAEVDSQRMVSAEVTLAADGSWTLTARSVAQRDSGVQDTTVFHNQGSYTLEGQVLTLLGQNAADTRPGKGTLTGATITSTEDGHVMVYRRRSTTP